MTADKPFVVQPAVRRYGGQGHAKSRAGRRTVPVARVLRKHLVEQRLARGRRGGLFFGREDGRPFSNQAVTSGHSGSGRRRSWRRLACTTVATRSPR
jgi:integrase